MSSLLVTLPPPPRRVRGILSGADGGWFARLFTLPHTLVGVGATSYWIFLWCWAWFGADLPAVITGTEVQQSRKGGTTYLVRYEFRVDREIKDRSSAVSLADYNRYQVQGDSKPRVTVRHLSFWLFENTELKNKVRLWNPPGLFTLWIGFWDTVVGAAFYILWIKPLRIRLLYKYGESLPGSVVGKRTKSGKSTTCFVAYVFNHPYTGVFMS